MGDLPNPGSNDAYQMGCTCPVMDNHHGAGIPTEDGPVFIIIGGCPLHDERVNQEEEV